MIITEETHTAFTYSLKGRLHCIISSYSLKRKLSLRYAFQPWDSLKPTKSGQNDRFYLTITECFKARYFARGLPNTALTPTGKVYVVETNV